MYCVPHPTILTLTQLLFFRLTPNDSSPTTTHILLEMSENNPLPVLAAAHSVKPAMPTAPIAPTTTPAPNAMAVLTPAQKKAQAKAEKAARRGQVVATKIVPPTPAAPVSKSPKQTTTATGGPKPVHAAPQKPKGPKIPDAFSHLSIAKKLPLSKADKDVHPSILAIGQQMANFTLKDNVARLEAMLVAFMKVGPFIWSLEAHINQGI